MEDEADNNTPTKVKGNKLIFFIKFKNRENCAHYSTYQIKTRFVILLALGNELGELLLKD